MCGIAGSRLRESGFDLYQQNLSRGYYSSSVTCLYPKGHLILKKEGALSIDDVPMGAEYYLFHSRGPTVETLQFEWDDNHPFAYGRFIVAHNGIIENANVLYGSDIGVDSRVIPFLLDQEIRKVGTEIKTFGLTMTNEERADQAVLNTLNTLQGTFGLWIYDTTDRSIRIVRSDITLFNYGTEFTSSNSGYLKEVEQNRIFKFRAGSNIMTGMDNLTLTKKPKYFIAGKPKSA